MIKKLWPAGERVQSCLPHKADLWRTDIDAFSAEVSVHVWKVRHSMTFSHSSSLDLPLYLIFWNISSHIGYSRLDNCDEIILMSTE
jgi:hypothetical protein